MHFFFLCDHAIAMQTSCEISHPAKSCIWLRVREPFTPEQVACVGEALRDALSGETSDHPMRLVLDLRDVRMTENVAMMAAIVRQHARLQSALDASVSRTFIAVSPKMPAAQALIETIVRIVTTRRPVRISASDSELAQFVSQSGNDTLRSADPSEARVASNSVVDFLMKKLQQ